MTPTVEQNNVLLCPRFAVVQAGPGTGKTFLIVERVKRLIAGRGAGRDCNDPMSIVVITFTRAAAAELRRRLAAENITVGFVGTVHGWALSRMPGWSACPQEIYEAMVEEKLRMMGVKRSVAAVLADEDQDFLEKKAVKLVNMALAQYKLASYDAMLEQLSSEIERCPEMCRGINLLIDEYQDAGRMERRIYEIPLWATIFAVGDEEQCLFSFRGASPDSMRELWRSVTWADDQRSRWYTLKTNHRSSLNVIAEALTGGQKNFNLAVQNIRDIRVNDERGLLKYDAVITGQNRHKDILAEEIHGWNPWREKEAAACREQMLIRLWPNDMPTELVERYAHCSKETSDAADEAVRKLHLDNPYADHDDLIAMVNDYGMESNPVILTCHASKGREFDRVLFVDDLKDTPEHRRMRYVAITRARKTIDIVRIE